MRLSLNTFAYFREKRKSYNSRVCDWWLMAVTDARRRKDPTQSRCGNCLPEFDLIFKECAISSQSSMCCVCSKRDPSRKKHLPHPLAPNLGYFTFQKCQNQKGWSACPPCTPCTLILATFSLLKENVKVNLGRVGPKIKGVFFWEDFLYWCTRSGVETCNN